MKINLGVFLGAIAVACSSLLADTSGIYSNSGQNMGTVSMPFTVFGTRSSSSDTHTFYFTSHNTGTYRIAIDPSFTGMRSGMSVTVSGQMSTGDYTLGIRTTDLPTSSCTLSLTANKKYKVVISGGSFTGSYSYYFSIGKTGQQVTYDANGGTFSSLIQTIGTSFNYTVDTMYGYLPTPTPPDGGTFLGWYTASSGGSAVFEMSTVAAGQSKLYAQYYTVPKFYYVAFNSNGGSGSMANQMHQYGVAKSLTQNSFTKSGSTFKGWSTYAGGPVVYADGASVKSLTSVENATVTLYAVWATQVKITFNAQGGDTGVSTADYYSGDMMGQLPIPSKTGYAFAGWYDSAVGGNRIQETDVISATRTLYAQWTPNIYTVSFVCPEDADMNFSSNYVYGTSYGKMPQPSSDGAYFAGWRRADGRIVDAETAVAAEDLALYAFWIAKNPVLRGVDFCFVDDYLEQDEGEPFVIRVLGGNEDRESSVKVYLSYQTASAADLNLGNQKFPMTLTWAAGEIGEKQVVIETKQDAECEANEALTFQLAEPHGMDVSSSRNMTVFIQDDDVMASLQEAINCPAVNVSTSGDGKWFAAKGDCYGESVDIGSYHAQSPRILPGKSATLSLGGFTGMTYLYYSLRFVGEENGLVSACVRIYDGEELIDTFWHSTYGDEWQNWVLTLPKDKHDVKFVFCQGNAADVHVELCSVMISHTSSTMDDQCVVNGYVFQNSGLVIGGGTVQYGSNVKLIAKARPGWAFDAWYTLNSDLTYEFWDAVASVNVTALTSFSALARFWKIPYIRALADPANGGTVAGSGYYADGNTYSLSATPAKNFYFAGWYASGTNGQNVCGDILLSKSAKYSETLKCPSNLTSIVQTRYAKFLPYPSVVVSFDLTGGNVSGSGSYAPGKKVILKATARKNFVFSGWYRDAEYTVPLADNYQLSTYAFLMGTDDMECFAKFIPTIEDQATIALSLQDEYATGVPIGAVKVDVTGCHSMPTVKVSGLPTGLKYDSKANEIYGTPTKSGVYTVVATVTTAGKKTASCSQTVVVRKSGENVVKAEVELIDATGNIASTEAVPGKVTGMGVYDKGKKVTLKATANKNYVFNGWYDEFSSLVSGLASYGFTMGDSDVALTAAFVTSDADKASIDLTVNGGPFPRDEKGSPVAVETNVYVGAYVEWPVAASALSATTVKVSGLPTGLKFTDKPVTSKVTTGTGKDKKTVVVTNVPANTIYGTPTAASKADKKGVVQPSKVVITVTTAGKGSQPFTINFTVLPLPTTCVGTFAGYALVQVNTNATPTAENETGWISLPCPFTATVDAKGGLSGSLTTLGKKLSFKATGYAEFDEDGSIVIYDVAIPLKSIDKTWTESLILSIRIAPGEATFASQYTDSPHLVVMKIDAQRNAAKDTGYATLAKPYAGTYVATFDTPLSDGVTTGLVTVALTVDAKGGVKAAGTFVDATTFSASATLAIAADGNSAEVLIPVTGKSFGSGGAVLAFGFAKGEDDIIAVAPLIDELGAPVSCAAKYVPATKKVAASYVAYDLLENASYAYKANAWVGEALTTDDLLSVAYQDGETSVEALYAFTASKTGAITGVGKTTNKAKLTFKLDAKTGLFTGANGKTKVFGALYPAAGDDATVSGLGSAALATGGVAPVSVGIFVNE